MVWTQGNMEWCGLIVCWGECSPEKDCCCGDWCFDNLSGSHHESWVNSCCQLNVNNDWQELIQLTTDNNSLDFVNDFHPGCWNVSHHYWQHSSSGLHSPGQSNYTITKTVIIKLGQSSWNNYSVWEIQVTYTKQCMGYECIRYQLHLGCIVVVHRFSHPVRKIRKIICEYRQLVVKKMRSNLHRFHLVGFVTKN